MELAKAHLDIGVYTDNYEKMRAFYVDELGLAYEELLKIGGGVHQHRLSLNGAVLKLNSSRQALAPEATNYVGLDLGLGRPDTQERPILTATRSGSGRATPPVCIGPAGNQNVWSTCSSAAWAPPTPGANVCGSETPR